MDPHVVEQIVPLSKQLLAVFNVTNENLSPAVSLGAKIFDESEFFRGRNYQFVRKLGHVDVFSIFPFYFRFVRDPQSELQLVTVVFNGLLRKTKFLRMFALFLFFFLDIRYIWIFWLLRRVLGTLQIGR